MSRLRRFVGMLRLFRQHRIPLDRHNIRAAWIQADPDWRSKLPVMDWTPEQWDVYFDALSEIE